MAEKPILYSGEMVRALLSGRKTQTRRPVTVPWTRHTRCPPYDPYYIATEGRLYAMDEYGDYHESEEWAPFHPGDVAWVRETWAPAINGDTKEPCAIYRADWEANGKPDGPEWTPGFRWCPSIHMKRPDCRLTHKVLSCRAERLQVITEEDAKAEGVALCNGHPELGAIIGRGPSYREGFAQAWRAIYGHDPRYAWEANPWVWRTESEKAVLLHA